MAPPLRVDCGFGFSWAAALIRRWCIIDGWTIIGLLLRVHFGLDWLDLTWLDLSSKCRRCVVIYEKHKNVLQYKESECDDMYMDQSNHPVSNPLPIRTMQKSSELNSHSSNGRGGAHPNTSGGHSRSSSDQYQFRSNDDNDNCKHQLFDIYLYMNMNIIIWLWFWLYIQQHDVWYTILSYKVCCVATIYIVWHPCLVSSSSQVSRYVALRWRWRWIN